MMKTGRRSRRMIALYQPWEVKPPARVFYRKDEFWAILETVSSVGEQFCSSSCCSLCSGWKPASDVLNFFLGAFYILVDILLVTFGLLLLLIPLL